MGATESSNNVIGENLSERIDVTNCRIYQGSQKAIDVLAGNKIIKHLSLSGVIKYDADWSEFEYNDFWNRISESIITMNLGEITEIWLGQKLESCMVQLLKCQNLKEVCVSWKYLNNFTEPEFLKNNQIEIFDVYHQGDCDLLSDTNGGIAKVQNFFSAFKKKEEFEVL